VPENDSATLVSGAHVRVYASTDLRHLILEIGSSEPGPQLVRLTEANARTLIGQLQSGVGMIDAVRGIAGNRHAPSP